MSSIKPISDTTLSVSTTYHAPGQKVLVAHATIMCVTFMLLMPVAALTTRLPIKVKITKLHVPWQILNVILVLIGMGLGTSVSNTRSVSKGHTTHILLGYSIVGLVVGVQPILGILQHLYFRKAGRRGIFGWMHMLLGRSIFILAWTNGSLGYKLADNHSTTAHYTFLGIIAALYISVLLWDWLSPKYKQRKGRETHPVDETPVTPTKENTTDMELSMATRI